MHRTTFAALTINLRSPTVRAAVGLCLVLSWLAGETAVAAVYAGRPLSEALRDLRGQGLRIVFTSHLIRPGMLVETEPTAQEPSRILDEILRSHGLGWRDGPGGRLIVVRPPQSSRARQTIRGQVRSRATHEPLGSIEIVAVGAGRSTSSDLAGRFELAGLPSGRYVLEALGPGFLPQRREGLRIASGRDDEVIFDLELSTTATEEIEVTSDRLSSDGPLASRRPTERALDAASQLDQDVFRVMSSLPGVSGQDDSAQFSLRGGRPDEVMTLLDGLEIIEPFHMKDFGSAQSFVTPTVVDSVELLGGGFDAAYGDRMGGVLEMTSVRPDRRLSAHLAAGRDGTQLGASGTLLKQRGRWLAAGRVARPDVPTEIAEDQQEARYWDGFAKLEWQLTPRQDLRGHWLEASDDYSFLRPQLAGTELIERDQFLTDYADSYLWATHQAVIGSRFVVSTTGSRATLRFSRFGLRNPETDDYAINDVRNVEMIGLRHAWSATPGGSRELDWGFESRQFEVGYAYNNTRPSARTSEAILANPDRRQFFGEYNGVQGGTYLTGRFRPRPNLTLDVGARYDHTEFADESHVSPRVDLAATLGPAMVLRAAWGYFYQSQRPYELQVPDGEVTFSPSELSESLTLGLERTFGRGTTLRVDAYHRSVDKPRALFENLYKPVSRFPEVETDRVLIAPLSRSSYGLEALFYGSHKRLDWQLSYAWARVMDDFASGEIPGRADQPHSLRLDVAYRTRWEWDFRLIWTAHTGRPTTPLSGRAISGPEGETGFEAVFGPLNRDRLPDYHRLDLQIHRQWRPSKMVLDLYLGIENLYDHDNVRGFSTDFGFLELPSGEVQVSTEPELGKGIEPSFGIRVGF